MKIIYFLFLLFILIGCKVNPRDDVEKTYFNEVCKELKLNKKFDFEIIYSQRNDYEGDYDIITICDVPFFQGKALKEYVMIELIKDSSMGVWTVSTDGFSLQPSQAEIKRGHFYRLEYSMKTCVLVLKEEKI